jgi:hypothetical protein
MVNSCTDIWAILYLFFTQVKNDCNYYNVVEIVAMFAGAGFVPAQPRATIEGRDGAETSPSVSVKVIPRRPARTIIGIAGPLGW